MFCGDSPRWDCLTAARRSDMAATRVAFLIRTSGASGSTLVTAGSVARRDLPALARLNVPDLQVRQDDAAHVLLDLPDAAARTACLAPVNVALRDAGLIRAWRHETYSIQLAAGAEPLAHIERAAARFWGTLTFGAHANGYRCGPDGRPSHLWIARRSLQKPTDPGRLDNLVGGGVPHDQLPFETLVREGWEEAGLPAELMRQARAGRIYRLQRDIPEGLQVSDLHVFDLELPADQVPHNQDGEVAEFRCLPVAEALECAATNQMTVDAALVTLDFALRHQLLSAHETTMLAPRAEALRRA